ncbi:hypothetical protein ACIBTV_27345, partial [Micromonospora sp. NPDC049366]|uniref:hypothetical protein n=1 Tax=Micromonospora sp. NPDC049366 TaxID=3364271 RepID=UPI003794E5DA
RRTRVPGRYERPAAMRAALGDRAGEAGLVAGYRAAVEANTAAAIRRATRRVVAQATARPARVEVGGVDLTPYLAGDVQAAGSHEHRRLEPPPAPLATVESAVTAERVELHEAAGSIREAKPGAGGVYVIDVIRSGWNTSGSRYYSAAVLERDVPKVYPKGTQMFIDHPGRSEQDERPERSLTTLAAVFLEDPWPVREDGGGVVMRTTARVFAPWQTFIAEAWAHIGVSINGNGHGEYGEAEGRHGLVLEELTYGQSVDFVTKPGAGGRVVGLLESAREAAASPAGRAAVLRESGSLGAYVESRIHLGFTQLADELYGEGRVTRAERITLSSAIGDALGVFVARVEADAPQVYQRGRWSAPDGVTDTAEAAAARTREATAEEQARALSDALAAAYGGKDRYCWTRDYDPDRGVVWFEAAVNVGDGPSEHRTWQQSYRRGDDGRVELLGDRVEVRPRTVYDPVRSDGSTAATTETTAGRRPAGSETGPAPDITARENDMGDKSPEVVAREAAEAQLATVTRERDETRDELARYRAGETAAPILDSLLAESNLPAPAQARVRAEFPAAALPLTESRALDEPRLRVLAEAAIKAEGAYVAQLGESAGVGRVTGMGAGAGAGTGAPSGALPAAFGTTRTAESAGPDQATKEALVDMYKRRGMIPEAALAAATGRN